MILSLKYPLGLYLRTEQYLLEQLLVRYVESQVYQGIVENLACEQAAVWSQ